MSIKLIAIDIDGTLINSSHQLTAEVHDAIQQAKKQGIKIVLSTGRPLAGIQKLLHQLELFTGDDYAITYNGSLVQNTETKQTVSSFSLTYEDYLEIDLLARRLNLHVHTESEDTIYTSNRDISPYTVHESHLVNMPIKYRTQEEMTPDISYIKMMIIDEPELLDAAIPSVPEDYKERYTIVKSAAFFLEIMNKEAQKGTALKRLVEHLELEPSEVMAIGDNENDLSMIKYAGLGVAMDNAIDVVKEHADVITLSNDEHGVAEAIKKYALK